MLSLRSSRSPASACRPSPPARAISRWIGAGAAIAATILGVGCAGGGCSTGCGGASLIPGGFPKPQRVGNAAGVRLTRAGLDFLEGNLGAILQRLLAGGGTVKGGVMTFPIPESKGSAVGVDYTICDGGPKPTGEPPNCTVEIKISGVKEIKIDSVTPHTLKVKAKVPLRLRKLPIKVRPFFFDLKATAGFGSGGNGDCGEIDYLDVPVTAEIQLENIPDDAVHAARAGYTKINISKVDFDKKAVEDNFKFCGGGIGDAIFGALKGLVIGQALSGITGQLTKPLQSATCMKAQKLDDATLQCPTGTFNRGGTCRYANEDAAECVPMLLGLESRFDLSGLLASISPSTSGGLDFMLASGGEMNPAADGMTLSMYGGAQPQPISNCVPVVKNDPPGGIDLPDELFGNSITGWPGAPSPAPHFGLGISERYLNHAVAGAYNSGLFCIAVTSEQIAQLDGGIISLILPSLKQISDQFSPAQSHPSLALAIHPQKAPTLKIGDGSADFKSPLIDLQLKDTDLDFYLWSESRFIRLFTGRIDVGVPLNLESGKEGLGVKFAPKSPIGFSNVRVSNNNILLETDKTISTVISSIGGLIPASALGSIKPFKLDSALAGFGLKLTIPKEGIRKVTKGSDAFLGVFASLEVAGMSVLPTETTARIVKMAVDPKNYDMATAGSSPPEIRIHATATGDDGTQTIEYAYKVDQGPWSTFEPGPDFRVDSPLLILQGKHTVSVASRVAGLVESEGEPVSLPFILDVLPPVVKVQDTDASGSVVRIVASDIVTAPNDLRVEARFDGGAWRPVDGASADRGRAVTERTIAVPPGSQRIDVRATDEAGNVGTASSALRGHADISLETAKSSCGCSVPGGDGGGRGDGTGSAGGQVALGVAAMLGAVVERRRRARRARELARATVLLTAVGAAGFVGVACAGGSGEAGDGNVDSGKGTGAEGGVPDNRPPVVSYVIGSYTSAAAAPDGTLWVAGYNEGDPTAEDFQADLVVGTLDRASGTVAWKAIDGVPNLPPKKNVNGFRGGVVEPGDDVGMYTSLALDNANRPGVSYFDRTNGALKYARFDGDKWTTHAIQSQAKGGAGRSTSLVMVQGKPIIAYQVLEPGNGGWARSKVRVARATTATPSSANDWSLEDVAVDEKTPCQPSTCADGQKCLARAAKTGVEPVCAPTTTGCESTCADACVKTAKGPGPGGATCAKTKASLGGYIDAIGASISMATTPGGDVALVFYDRIHGNLRGAKRVGGKWTTQSQTDPIDGWVGDAKGDKGRGDRGLGATLLVDSSGTWHIAYIDGIREQLLYKSIPGGELKSAREAVVVDDGATADGTAATKFPEGLHLVGEDAHLVVDAGTVKIVYQDSTAGTLRWARATAGAKPSFTRGVSKQEGFAGFFPRITGGQVVNFYRMRGTTVAEGASASGDAVVLGNVRAVPLP